MIKLYGENYFALPVLGIMIYYGNIKVYTLYAVSYYIFYLMYSYVQVSSPHKKVKKEKKYVYLP